MEADGDSQVKELRSSVSDVKDVVASTVGTTTNASNKISTPVEIPIISLSDGDEEEALNVQHEAQTVLKKRKSMEGSIGREGGGVTGIPEGEKRYRLKRRKIKVAGAPKMPLTGYVRYMNTRRETLRKEQPTKTAIEHTKIIGEEWQALTEELKAPYMKAAELDKQRYVAELHFFLKARPDVLACELARNKQRKNSVEGSSKSVLKEKPQPNGNLNNGPILSGATKEVQLVPPNEKQHSTYDKSERCSPPPLAPLDAFKRKRSPSPISTLTAPVPGEIPIFTNEFLEHNKIFDMELRTLRKSKADLEQQNAVLEKHVENMKFGVEKMTTENDELQEKNRLLELYLDKLKRKLAQALSGLAIPSEPNGATVDNIDKYMNDLYNMATTHTHGPGLNKAKDIIRKLDLQIQL